MNTSPYFLEDAPLQILFLDKDKQDARFFFEQGMGTAFFDYDLHIISSRDEASAFIGAPSSIGTPPSHDSSLQQKQPDLLLISNRCWNEEGEALVHDIRANQKLRDIPVYCVASCAKKINSATPQCWNADWRLETDCNKDARIAAIPFDAHLARAHKTQLNGVICANNIERELTSILQSMTDNWFCS